MFWAISLPAALYALTIFPGPGGRFGIGDALDFQSVGRVLGVSHEPGYPQYVVLSYLWGHLPFPVSLATKINMLSAVFALAAGALIFAAARRVSGSPAVAVASTWLVLLGSDVWSVATQAEVYSLTMFWVAAVIFTAAEWRATGNRAWLVTMMFCYSASFGNHLLMLMLLPALVFLVLATDASVFRSARMLAAGALAVAAGMAQYLLLWWRSYNPIETLLPRFPREATFGEILR